MKNFLFLLAAIRSPTCLPSSAWHSSWQVWWLSNPTLQQIALVCLVAPIFLCSCRTKQHVDTVTPISHEYIPEHSPNVFLVMYDAGVGKEPLLKAIKDYKVEIIYDYNIINGMALKKPDGKTLEETMQYFKKVKGVTHVEYDNVYRLTDPVKPKLEIK